MMKHNNHCRDLNFFPFYNFAKTQRVEARPNSSERDTPAAEAQILPAAVEIKPKVRLSY